MLFHVWDKTVRRSAVLWFDRNVYCLFEKRSWQRRYLCSCLRTEDSITLLMELGSLQAMNEKELKETAEGTGQFCGTLIEDPCRDFGFEVYIAKIRGWWHKCSHGFLQ